MKSRSGRGWFLKVRSGFTVLAVGFLVITTQAASYDVPDGAVWTDTSGVSNANLLGSATLGANNIVDTLNISPSANGKGLGSNGGFSSVTILSGVLNVLPNNVSYNAWGVNLIFGATGNATAVINQGTGLFDGNDKIYANGLILNGGGSGFNLFGDQSTTLLGTITVNSGILRLLYNGSKLAPSSDVVINGGNFINYQGQNTVVATVTLNGGQISEQNPGPNSMTANSFALKNGSVSVNLAGATATLVKSTTDTVTLSANNTYGGSTTVTGGTLNVTGQLASNGTDKVFIAVDADGFDTGVVSPTLARTIQANSAYTGYGSTVVNGSNTAVSIVIGSNTTAAAKAVTMQWRNPVALDTNVISSVSRLTGMEWVAGGHTTDVFTLQMNFADISDKSRFAARGQLFLGWYSNQTTWVNATLGNYGTGSTVVSNYRGSWSAFAAAQGGITEANLATYLGSWGVDTVNNQVWAVLNHNSDFGVLALPLSLRGTQLQIF